MTHILDIDTIEGTVARIERKRTPANTNPLALEKNERKVVDQIADEIAGKLRPSSGHYHQFLTFHAALQGMEAALSGDWQALLGAAETGLSATFEVQNVSSYLICKQDGAKRNLASDQRNALKELALRLGHAAPANSELEADLAKCLRAMTYAAIAADRGLMHLVKDNFGVVIVTIGAPTFGAKSKIAWTDALDNLSKRYRNAQVRMP